mmetsp:Transcript_10778/g.31991  ORF Transcript_10778/g.31991 Transcript_10778/m.31991 type:complete len:214 (-) Transcript_10778:2581-3222(-)
MWLLQTQRWRRPRLRCATRPKQPRRRKLGAFRTRHRRSPLRRAQPPRASARRRRRQRRSSPRHAQHWPRPERPLPRKKRRPGRRRPLQHVRERWRKRHGAQRPKRWQRRTRPGGRQSAARRPLYELCWTCSLRRSKQGTQQRRRPPQCARVRKRRRTRCARGRSSRLLLRKPLLPQSGQEKPTQRRSGKTQRLKRLAQSATLSHSLRMTRSVV